MSNIEVSALEIEEVGIVLPADGDHLVRVLGARRQLHFQMPPMKEKLGPLADQSVFDRYYSGALTAPDAAADPSSASELFITESGEPVVVKSKLA
jgi:hypothetical protein